ncbi:hypothetical protein TSAR_011795 [Trichomalopsis sarcophagae]|uniref:BED-type domain-containing protein n=1 Tax=Trichomalopsis sarcophagae TaxID=543379 RepID=A0A232EUE1_9HYME|nr:hypothetical protein TSAR_011795 [Trichomalopsis sarcophagae]
MNVQESNAKHATARHSTYVEPPLGIYQNEIQSKTHIFLRITQNSINTSSFPKKPKISITTITNFISCIAYPLPVTRLSVHPYHRPPGLSRHHNSSELEADRVRGIGKDREALQYCIITLTTSVYVYDFEEIKRKKEDKGVRTPLHDDGFMAPTSSVWKYFVKGDKESKCKLCNKEVKCKGNTTNLNFHIQRHHPEITHQTQEKETSESKSMKRKMDEALSESDSDRFTPSPAPSTSNDSISNSCAPVVVDHSGKIRSSFNINKQIKLDSAFATQKSFQGGEGSADITNGILFYIAKNNVPFDVVETEGFKVLMHKAVPLYKVPGRKTITRLTEEKYEVLSSIIKEELAAAQDICLTTDVWTETGNTRSFLGLTAHYLVKNTKRKIDNGPDMPTASELKIIKEFTTLLDPFYNATQIVSKEKYFTGSKTIPVIKTIKNKLNNIIKIIPVIKTIKNKLNNIMTNTESGSKMKALLLEEFCKRFEHIEQNSLLAIACLLDPRFKKLHFEQHISFSNAVNKEKNDANQLGLGSASNDFWSFHQNIAHLSRTKKNEVVDKNEMPAYLRYYLNQPVEEMNCDPVAFWDRYRDSALYKIARRYLSIMSTSVPSERLFSQADNIMIDTRNKLNAEHLQQLLFLHSLSYGEWKI